MSLATVLVRSGVPGVPPRTLTGPEDCTAEARDVYFSNIYQVNRDMLDGAVVLDVGANIGAFTLLALDHGATHVYAVEPDPNNALHLLANVERAALAPRVTLLRGAAGDPAVPLVLGAGTGVHRTTRAGDDGDHLQVWSLDQLLSLAEAAGPVVCKVDAEGAEYAFVASASPAALDRLAYVLMEWHGNIAAGQPGALGRIGPLVERLLPTHSVTLFGLPAHGGMLFAHHH